MSELKDFYRVLGVQAGATPEQVQDAYRQAYEAAESQRGAVAARLSLDLDIAFAVVGDPEARRHYDRARAGEQDALAAAPGGWFEQGAHAQVLPPCPDRGATPSSAIPVPLMEANPRPVGVPAMPWEWKAPESEVKPQPIKPTREMLEYKRGQEQLGCLGVVGLVVVAALLWLVTDTHFAFIGLCLLWVIIWGIGMSLAKSSLTKRVKAKGRRVEEQPDRGRALVRPISVAPQPAVIPT